MANVEHFTTTASNLYTLLEVHADVLDLVKLDCDSLGNFSTLEDSETNISVDVDKLEHLTNRMEGLFTILCQVSRELYESTSDMPPSYTRQGSYFENIDLGGTCSHTVHLEHALYKQLLHYTRRLHD